MSFHPARLATEKTVPRQSCRRDFLRDEREGEIMKLHPPGDKHA